MRAKLLVFGLLLALFLAPSALAATMTITQSGADGGTVMKSQFFTITVSGLSGSGTANLIDTPSGFSSEEGTSKSFSEGTTSVSWTTTKISQLQNNIMLKASISIAGSPSTAESDIFDVVLPPALSLSVSPSTVTVDKDSTYTVTLTVQNSGGTSANSVSLSVSGTGMSASCPTITSVSAGGSSSATCTVTASEAGTISTTFTATPSNCESKTDTISVTVEEDRGDGGNPGSNSPGGGTATGSVGSSSFWSVTYPVTDEQFAAGYSKALRAGYRLKVAVGGEYHYVGLISTTANTATINVSSTSQQATLSSGEERMFEITGDNYYDLLVRLESVGNGTANVTVVQVNTEIPLGVQEPAAEETGEGPFAPTETDSCIDGAIICESGELRECINGEWRTVQLCEYGCNANRSSCKVAPDMETEETKNNIRIFLLSLLVILAVSAYILVVLKKRSPRW
ncbi:MAG: CARDB domain-containing protein [Candidatus Aenigmatarchaeota archaeon]